MNKTCNVCTQSKSMEDFNFTKNTKDGRKSKCRSCEAKYSRQWRANNVERCRELSRINTEKLKLRRPDYYKEWVRADYATPEGRAKWIKRSADKRAAKRGAEGSYTAKEFLTLCERFGNICLRCMQPTERLTADHVVPLSRGGSNYIDNIQPLCRSCNSAKGNRSSEDYRQNFAL